MTPVSCFLDSNIQVINKLLQSRSKLRLSRPSVDKNVLKSLLFHEYQVHVQTGTKIMHLIENTSSKLDEFFPLINKFHTKVPVLDIYLFPLIFNMRESCSLITQNKTWTCSYPRLTVNIFNIVDKLTRYGQHSY